MYTYEELKNFVDHCGRCPLAQTRNRAVMGAGQPPVAGSGFIAEGSPGQE